MKTKILITILTSGLLLFSCSNHKGNKEKTSAGKEGKPKQEINSQKTDSSMAKPIHLTKADFLTKVANYEQNPDKWVYLGNKPCIIDFYADWCGPCKMIAPVLEELAQEYDGQIYIYKVDTEAEQELAADFGIRSIPTLLFCPMNENPQMAQGALPKDVLKEAIEEVLLKES